MDEVYLDRSQLYAVQKWKDLEDAVFVLRQDNYEVHRTRRLQASTTHTLTAVLNLGMGPNLVHPKVIPLVWERIVQEKKSPNVTDESHWSMDIRGAILLCIQVSHLTVSTWFLVCPNLWAKGIPWARFIDRYVKSIYSGQKKVNFHRAPLLTIDGSRRRPEIIPKGQIVLRILPFSITKTRYIAFIMQICLQLLFD